VNLLEFNEISKDDPQIKPYERHIIEIENVKVN
jgi:hypothetical protein